MADAKKDRNREIFEARESGASFTSLAKKYGVTETCVRIIYMREERKERLKQHKYYQLLTSLTDNEEMITRTIHVLERSGYDSDEAIMSVTRAELLRCRNCGEVMINLIFQIADKLREEKK